MIKAGWKFAPNREMPINLPAPITSLKKLKHIAICITKLPIPRPSNKDAIIPFLLAKASALPKIIQLTTINGMKYLS